ncbi:MAG: glycosyltransferase family 2 protein [Acidimicrobiia bacterium]|nr:glycosyltransferase family 2 protein [Acidimicrobiia bacterium]
MPSPFTDERVRLDGKHFALRGHRFAFRGVTYGTFRPRDDGERFPERGPAKLDLVGIADAGFSVVRTYTAPPDDIVELAADQDLHLLAGVFYPDWRYLVGASRRQRREMARAAEDEVRATARRLAGRREILALSLGNEVPADVVRFLGPGEIGDVIARLADVAHEEDPDVLVTYANYPSTEYLPLDSLDFLTFNVFLEDRENFRRYLTRLHHLAGDRPLVLGEVGLHAGDGDEAGERRQADAVDWQLETALERGVAGTCIFSWTDEWWVGDAAVEGWRFGLTRADRSPRPALGVAERWNARTVADLHDRDEWPSISVVVCAYNAEDTLDECLTHACALDYPKLEVIVVDDGSTDATADIARRHDVRLATISHAGLSTARNEGLRLATGDLVAYLDADAYPQPEWPYYLALGMDAADVGGVGGPNVPPPDDPPAAQRVARAPGGPLHVLLSDDRAEHVPGCNMAFWREVLTEVGGFDPIFTSAGDDVDLCWRVLEHDWKIAFHPAALVWHHRRPGLRAYLRQQRGYGRSEALVEVRHPSRYTITGTAQWQGRIYDSFPASVTRQRVYHGLYGTAAYQSVYRGGGHTLDLLHQVGVPTAVLALLTAPLALLHLTFGVPAALAAVLLVTLGIIDVRRARPPRRYPGSRVGFGAGVAVLEFLQPLVRLWGRVRHRPHARERIHEGPVLPGPPTSAPGGVLMLPADGPRAELAAGLVNELRRRKVRVLPPNEWEAHDAAFVASTLLVGELVTSSYPEGCVQVRVRTRVRTAAAVLYALAALVGLAVQPLAAAAVAALVVAELGRGMVRSGPRVRRIVRRAAESGPISEPERSLRGRSRAQHRTGR